MSAIGSVTFLQLSTPHKHLCPGCQVCAQAVSGMFCSWSRNMWAEPDLGDEELCWWPLLIWGLPASLPTPPPASWQFRMSLLSPPSSPGLRPVQWTGGFLWVHLISYHTGILLTKSSCIESYLRDFHTLNQQKRMGLGVGMQESKSN